MKFNEKHYNMVKKSLEKYDSDILLNHKKHLKQQIKSNEITVANFETRFIADIYYSCVPLETRMLISDEGDYKEIHLTKASENLCYN